MTPLGWFAMGCLATGALVAIAYFAIFRRRSTSQVDRSILVESERTRLLEEVEAEKVVREKTREAKERLETGLCELLKRRKKALEELNERTDNKVFTYIDDPDLLLGEIDRILAGSSSKGSEENALDEGREGAVLGDPPDARGDGHDPGGIGGTG